MGMKRHYEDESLNLIGRSAAERHLDRFYNKQKVEIKKQRTQNDSHASSSHVNVPFPDVNNKKEPTESATTKPQVRNQSRDLKSVLEDLRTKHLLQRNKFAKSLNVFTKILKGYFISLDEHGEHVQPMDLVQVMHTVDSEFTRQFGASIPKEAQDVKAALLEFVDLINGLLDGSIYQDKDPVFQSDGELAFFQYIKKNIGFSVQLWYLDDSFVFSNIVKEISNWLEGLVNASSYDDGATDVNNDRNEDTNDAFTLPSAQELFGMEKKALVRTLEIVFYFRRYAWAKSQMESLYYKAYLSRDIFDDEGSGKISHWQSQIKSKTSASTSSFGGDVPPVAAIGESSFEVQDAREERLSSVHGSQVWSRRQFGL